MPGGRRANAWRWTRLVTWVIVGPLLAGLAIVSLTVLYARTDGGRARVRRLALVQAHRFVPGLDVGRVEGDYVHELRLVDVNVRDREGRVAVHADAIVARFELGPLLHHVVVVRDLRVDGARVDALPAADGHLNLTELVTATAGPSRAVQDHAAPSRWRVHVDRVAVDGAATIDVPESPRVDVTSLALVAAVRMDDVLHVELQRLDLEAGAAGRLSLQGTATTARTGSGSTTLGGYDLALRANGVDPSRVMASPAARLAFTLSARGNGAPLAPDARASATLSLAPSEIAGLEVSEGHAAASAIGDRWTLVTLGAKSRGLTLVGSGRGERSRLGAADLKVTLDGALPAAHGGPADVRGEGALSVHASGAWPALDLRVAGDVRALRVAGARAGKISIAGTLAGPPTAPRGYLRVDARALVLSPTAPRLDRVALVASDDAGALRVDATAVGPRVRGGLRAHGRATRARADVTVDAFSLDFATRQYRQIVSLLRPTRLRFEPGRVVQWDPTAVRGAGYRFTGDATTDGAFWLTPSESTLALGHLSLRHASFAGLAPLDADLQLDLSRRRATVKLAAGLPRAGARVTLAASIPVVVPRRGPIRVAKTGGVDVHLTANCVRLQDLPVVDTLLAHEGITGGVARLDLDVTGDVAHPDAKGRFDVRDVMYRNIHGLGRDSTLKTVPGLGGSLTLDTAPGSTHVVGSLLIRGAGVLTVDARARVDLGRLVAGEDPRAAPMSAHLDVPRWELASLADFIDELKGASGQLTAHADLEGTLAHPSGTVEAKVANAKTDELTFRDVEVHARADGAHARATLAVTESRGGTLSATADLDRAGGDRVVASAVARDLDLGFVRLFAPTLRETAGIAQLSARASGSLRAPSVEASLVIEKGRLGVVGQPTFHDLRLAATLKPGRADLTRLEMRSGDGTLSGTGWVTLDGLSPRRAVLTAHAHRFLVAAAGATGARLDGDLAVEAALRRDVVDGQVDVPRAEVWLPKTPTGAGRDLQKIGPHDDVRFVDQTARDAATRHDASARAAAARTPPRDLDVRVRTGTIYVRGKDLDLEIDSTLKVGRAPSGVHVGRPTLAGGIHIRRGHINIESQRFDFTRGDITFNGGTELNPELDIRIERQYPDALVVVELGGTPNKPSLHLTSDPPIFDQAQIVSLVLTGQAGGQPSTGKAFDPTTAVATAVLSRLADELAPAVGLDVLRVENVKQVNGEGVATGDTDTRVEVGKYISERVYLSYAHVFGANEYTNENEAQVEYRFTRRWMLESVFGDAGVGGVDVLWTYRY